MAAFLQIEGIEGESTSKDHENWILIESMRSAIHRTVSPEARDMERVRGRTTLDEVVVVRQLDKSSVRLQDACANGTFFNDVEIHFCTCVNDHQQPFLKYKLWFVMLTGYAFRANADASRTRPSEAIRLDYAFVEWEYSQFNHKTGKMETTSPASYVPGGLQVSKMTKAAKLAYFLQRRVERARKFSFPLDVCPRCGSQGLLRAHCWGLDIAEWYEPNEAETPSAMLPSGVPFDRDKFQGCTECGLMWNEVPVESYPLWAYSLRKTAMNRGSPNIDSSHADGEDESSNQSGDESLHSKERWLIRLLRRIRG